MRYLLNAFSPTMLQTPNTSHVVFRTLTPQAAKPLFSVLNSTGVNALNPRHPALFETFKHWGAVAPESALSVSLAVGDDALILLPKAQNRMGAEVQTQTVYDYQYLWCGVLDSAHLDTTPKICLYEIAGGDVGDPWFETHTLSPQITPTDLIEVAYGCDWEASGLALHHSAPIKVYRGMIA